MISIYMSHVDGHETLDFVDEASMVQTYLENECDALIDTLSRDELESSVFLSCGMYMTMNNGR